MGVYEFYDSETGSIVYYVAPSPDLQNEASTIESESESVSSRTTIQSDEVSDYYVLHHGRVQFASSSVTQWVPPDNIRRHIVRQLLCKWTLGGDYIGPVPELLAEMPGKVHRVLDLGTRAGTWVQTMAAAFPHVQFLSLDLAPVIAHVPRPNVVFEVYDFAKGLLMDDGSQDIVFLNGLAAMVSQFSYSISTANAATTGTNIKLKTKDYPALLLEVHRVLRPGGLIHTQDFDINMWGSENKNDTIVARRTNPAAYRYTDLIREHISSAGIDPDICAKTPGLLASDSDLWIHDSSQKSGFFNVHSVVKTFPYYPHPGFPCACRLDPILMAVAAHFTSMTLQDSMGLLEGRGMTTQQAKQVIDEAIAELKQPDKCLLGKLYCTYGTKL